MWFTVFWIVMIGIFVGSLVYQSMKFDEVKNELYKIVQQSGGRNIQIEGSWFDNNNHSYRFVVQYVDVHGNHQTRKVTRHDDEFLWNKPLISGEDSHLTSRLSSKEQIISDMDTEIQRLRSELELAKQSN